MAIAVKPPTTAGGTISPYLPSPNHPPGAEAEPDGADAESDKNSTTGDKESYFSSDLVPEDISEFTG